MDGITHKYFFIEEDLKEITIFEKKTNLLNQKKELYNQKKKIKRNNKIIKGLFLNDNCIYYSI